MAATRSGKSLLRRFTSIAIAGILAGGLLQLASPAQATSPGVNGKIAFSTDNSDDPSKPQIWTVNPDGSGETLLTPNSHAAAPDWSPDGAKIAFQSPDSGQWQIYVMNADGTVPQQITSDDADHFNPRFSPDGSQIAYSACPPSSFGTCAIYVVNIGRGRHTPVQLTSLTWFSADPEFSPDGTKIVFDSNQDGLVSAVWVMNADGTGQQRLTDPSLEAFYPDWAPDGAHIIFTDNCCLPHSNVWVMKPDGSGLKQLTNMPQNHGAGFASYSPDGKKILLQSDLKSRCGCTGDLYTMDANGTHLTRIVSDQPAVFLSDWGSAH